jgi:DNA-binding NarL/FixJ family response regulator
MISVVIAGDRILVRQSFTRLLSAHARIRVAGDAPPGASLLSLLSRESPDVLLLDAAATATGTASTIRRLHAQTRARILVAGQFPEEVCRSAMVRAGAAAYLGPDRDETQLLTAIERVVSGQIGRATATGRGAAEGLSGREFDVLCLMGSGLNGRAVAAALGLSPKTVSTYRSRILAKLELGGTAEIVRYAVEHGFQSEP